MSREQCAWTARARVRWLRSTRSGWGKWAGWMAGQGRLGECQTETRSRAVGLRGRRDIPYANRLIAEKQLASVISGWQSGLAEETGSAWTPRQAL